MDQKTLIKEDLEVCVGIGATTSNGRDCYPYYVSEVLPNGIIGIYRAGWHFDAQHPWEGGDGVVDPFDQQHTSDFYIKRRYGKWWQVDGSGKPIEPFTGKYLRLSFGRAHAFQDPSF